MDPSISTPNAMAVTARNCRLFIACGYVGSSSVVVDADASSVDSDGEGIGAVSVFDFISSEGSHGRFPKISSRFSLKITSSVSNLSAN